jgi:hypothetical protein
MLNIQKKYLKYKQKYLILKNNQNIKNLYGGVYSKCSSNPYFTQIFSLFNIFNKKPNPPEWNVDDKLLFSPNPSECNVSRTNSIISNLFGLMCNLQCDLTKLTIFKDCANVIIIDWANIIHIINNYIFKQIELKYVNIRNRQVRYNMINVEVKETIIKIVNIFIIKYLESNHIIFIIYKPVTIFNEDDKKKQIL